METPTPLRAHPLPRRRSALHELTLANDLSSVTRELESGTNVDVQDGRMWTALHLASLCGENDMAALLIKNGANLGAREQRNWTPLHMCSQGKSTEIAKMLVERGVDLEAKEKEDRTPLHLCSQFGSTEIAKMLVERGVDLEAKQKEGRTPLHLCSQFGSTEIAKMLMELGVDLEAKEKEGRTPLHICSQHGSTEISRMLINNGAELEAKTDDGLTALQLSLDYGTNEIAEMLIDRGVDPEVKRKCCRCYPFWCKPMFVKRYGSSEIQVDETARSYALDHRRYPYRSSTEAPNLSEGESQDSSHKRRLEMGDTYGVPSFVKGAIMSFKWEDKEDGDCSVALLNERMKSVDLVCYYKSKSACGSVVHSGNRFSGEKEDEIIKINLARLPLYIHYLVFIIPASVSSTVLNQVENLEVEMRIGSRPNKGKELFVMSLKLFSDKAMLVGLLTRRGPVWSFKALGKASRGKDAEEVLKHCTIDEFLPRLPFITVGARNISVYVLEGKNLDAKNNGFHLRKQSSDPYYIVNFKGQKTKSEVQKQSLNPVWSLRVIELGSVKEAETDLLEILLFSHNFFRRDCFMGIVRVTAGELHALGVGEHSFWFKLGSSIQKSYRHANVSGEILLQFRIREPLQDFAHSYHTSVRSTEIARDPQSSSAPANIEKNNGETSWERADLNREFIREIIPVLEKNAVALSSDLDKNRGQKTMGERAGCSDTHLNNVDSQATPESEIDRKTSLASTHRDERQMAGHSSPELGIETEDAQSTSDEEVSSSSEAGMWISDAPYGSRQRLLKAVGALKRGQHFADDYTIGMANFAGRPHLRLAEQKFGNKEAVVLKFYWEEATFDNAIEMHSKVARSAYVCRIVQTLKTSKTGYPPCIVFEKGKQTLREWLLDDRPMFDRRWCLCQILTGLMEIHAERVVHCDLKPSNVVFFPESIKWKLIDLDGARKAGEGRVSCFTAPYAAPEVLREWSGGELPVAQPSSDIWSYGILAFEGFGCSVMTSLRTKSANLSRKEKLKRS